MLLVVLNLIASFRALGTLMAVGLMILPATSARYWVSSLTGYVLVSMAIAMASCMIGIALSLTFTDIPTGPCIVIVAGGLFLFSLVLGPNGLGINPTVVVLCVFFFLSPFICRNGPAVAQSPSRPLPVYHSRAIWLRRFAVITVM